MTKTVKIGNRIIGGGNPILIQSMTNTRTEDVNRECGGNCRTDQSAYSCRM